MKKHTIVLHLSPDLEALFMAYLALEHNEVRQALGIDTMPSVKFIPAGPLREEDWPDVETDDLNAEHLEENGYVFFDCGGGELDQHNKPWLAGQKASIDLLVDQIGRPIFEPACLLPVVQVISENDLTGKQVIKDGGMRKSSTPNVPRHLRNLIIGWNILFSDDPQKVLELAIHAFGAIESLASEKYGRLLGKAGMTRERVLSSKRMTVRSFFLAEAIKDEVLRTADPAYAEYFAGMVQDALVTLQHDWEQATADFSAKGTAVHEVRTERMENGVTFSATLVIAAGVSDTIAFGQVSRFRGNGRLPANVTVQFGSDGKFMISTDGRYLDDVAAEVRKADFAKRGIVCEDMEFLARRGHVHVEGTDGPEEAIYFAEFGKAVGNRFRANPHESSSLLTREEVLTAVLRGLGAVSRVKRRDGTSRPVLDQATAERLSAKMVG